MMTPDCTNTKDPDQLDNRKLDQLGCETDKSPSATCSDDELCDNCLQIDFEGAFQIPDIGRKRHGVLIAELGTKTDEWGQEACPTCRLFAAVRIPPRGASVTDTSEYHLRACSFLKATDTVRVSRQLWEPFKKADSPCLLVLQGHGHSRNSWLGKQSLKFSRTGGIISPVVSSTTESLESSTKFQVRRILPGHIDYHLLRSWYDLCVRHHPKKCAVDSKERPDTLKVIDCQTKKIVEAPPDSSYIALSYVWGQGQSPIVTRPQQPGGKTESSILFPDTIPSVITDAMTVTVKLGWQYLWVDRYCIDQNDEVKHTQINQMDRVYSSAVITLIAAAGDSAWDGLPGVLSTLRRTQPHAMVRGRLLASTLRTPEKTIGSSRWATRAWTYQEAALSKRRLIFTEEQVFFECKHMTCCEDRVVPLDLLNYKAFEYGFRSMVQQGYFEAPNNIRPFEALYGIQPTERETLSRFSNEVERYTARELSYEMDSLNAFKGMLNYYRNGRGPLSFPLYTHLGLPLNSGESPSIVETYADTPQFVWSLTWEHRISLNRVPPKRRKGYPSFSWAGWAGVASIPIPVYARHFKSMIQILREPGTASDLSAPPDAVLCLEADMIQGQIEVSEDSISHALKTSFHLAVVGSRKNPILLPDDFLSRHKGFSHGQPILIDCIIIGNRFKDIYIMMIEYHGEIAERIGVVHWDSRNSFGNETDWQNLNKKRRRICLG